MTPQRIQRQRAKGWRMPEGAVYVGRRSRWGNPFQVGDMYARFGDRRPYALAESTGPEAVVANVAEAVRLYRDLVLTGDGLHRLEPLRGKELACWCPLDQPCHADVLLELANR